MLITQDFFKELKEKKQLSDGYLLIEKAEGNKSFFSNFFYVFLKEIKVLKDAVVYKRKKMENAFQKLFSIYDQIHFVFHEKRKGMNIDEIVFSNHFYVRPLFPFSSERNELFCDSAFNKTEDDLREIAVELNFSLEDWKEMISSLYNDYYHLMLEFDRLVEKTEHFEKEYGDLILKLKTEL